MDNTLFLDIESTDLDLDMGNVICVGVATDDKPVEIILRGKKEKPWMDRNIMRQTYDRIVACDMLVTYYGKGFDWPALQTRMLLAGLPPLPPLGGKHVDLYWMVKQNFKLHSNKLENVAIWLECPFQKTPHVGASWSRAGAGSPKDIEYIVEHCYRDIEILRWVYYKLRPYVRQHPAVSVDAMLCRSCGEAKLQKRGFVTRVNGTRGQRVQCTNCGRWDTLNDKGKVVIK